MLPLELVEAGLEDRESHPEALREIDSGERAAEVERLQHELDCQVHAQARLLERGRSQRVGRPAAASTALIECSSPGSSEARCLAWAARSRRA